MVLNTFSDMYWACTFLLLRTVCSVLCPLIDRMIYRVAFGLQFLPFFIHLRLNALSGMLAKILSRSAVCLFTLMVAPLLCRSLLILCNPICQFLRLFSVLLESFGESLCLPLCSSFKAIFFLFQYFTSLHSFYPWTAMFPPKRNFLLFWLLLMLWVKSTKHRVWS